MVRSATTEDSVSTRFGRIPLELTPAQSLVSPRHSRLSLDGEMRLGKAKVIGFVETDFFNAPLDRQPYRFRQYFASYQQGEWEILGGQAWSLLRPNRDAVWSDHAVMSTHVPEPAYHPGLAGQRTRQIRVVRKIGAWRAAASFEHGNQFLSKVTHDDKRLHGELAGLAGIHSERGVSAAAVIHATKKVDVVTQQFWSRGAGAEALGVLPGVVATFTTISGIEAKVTRNIELFAYAGNAHAARSSSGNRHVGAWTLGFLQLLRNHPGQGACSISGQFSQLERSTWAGKHGAMTYVTLSLRYYLPTFR
ncbi:MAG TPA: hypothetical protein VMZ52_10070 [Bryobacteraceae bacterium]|nr:hypothetical protein [Bryobacteraceae bacterium]